MARPRIRSRLISGVVLRAWPARRLGTGYAKFSRHRNGKSFSGSMIAGSRKMSIVKTVVGLGGFSLSAATGCWWSEVGSVVGGV